MHGLQLAEAIAGFLASLIAIAAGVALALRWIGGKIDKWGEALVENSSVTRDLSTRVSKLERTIANGSRS